MYVDLELYISVCFVASVVVVIDDIMMMGVGCVKEKIRNSLLFDLACAPLIEPVRSLRSVDGQATLFCLVIVISRDATTCGPEM